MAECVGVVIPFTPRSARSGDASGAPPPGRWSPQPVSPAPLGGGRPAAPFPRPSQPRSRWHWSSLPRLARFALIGAGAFILLFGASWMRCGWAGCPDVKALAAYQPGGAPVVFDRDGRPLTELAPVEGERVRLGDLPPYVPRAFVAVEDRRFEKHHGVDWLRVPSALAANVRSRGVEEGFSTITMQLARNVFPERLPGQERTLKRKLLEIRVAQEIERQFHKDDILEMYLNNIYFGNGARGIEAAARVYFGKPAARLTLPEAALLAGMPKAPNSYDPRRHPDRARERRDLVLSLMEKQGVLRADEAQAARATRLRVRSTRRRAGVAEPAPYFIEQVQQEVEERLGPELYHRPWRVRTTLDPRVQRAAEEELGRQLALVQSGAMGPPGGRGPLQGAVVVLDAATGDVLAWVGGRDFAQSRFDRVTDARRQAGSAFKPFVYAAALDSGVALNDWLEDAPLRVQLGGGRYWEPRNFEGTFDGRVTVRDALVRSKNVPTIRLAESVGIDTVAELAEHAGVDPPIPREPSMPLGTVAVSPLELATAFTAFARLGTAVKPRLVTRVETPEGDVIWQAEPETRPVLQPATAYLIDDVLQEALARGTGTAVREAGFNAPAAGKTGTTSDGADAWFVGFTPDVVAAVWVGYDAPAPIVPRATGGRLAAPVWARIMLRLYQGRPRSAGWAQPPGVVQAWIDPTTGQRLAAGCRPVAGGARRELFLASHVPPESCPASGAPEVLAAEATPMEGYEEFSGAPDVPPLDLERTPVPPDEDASGEAVSPVPGATPTPVGARPIPRATATPRPEPAEGEEPAEEPRAATPSPAAPTPTPTPGAFR